MMKLPPPLDPARSPLDGVEPPRADPALGEPLASTEDVAMAHDSAACRPSAQHAPNSSCVTRARLEQAHRKAREELLAMRDPNGCWTGHLAPSALSTATAVSALSVVRRHQGAAGNELNVLVDRGIAWLIDQQNTDGGWGDTNKSYSNIATTMLVVAAFELAGVGDVHRERLQQAERFVQSQGGLEGLRQRYGIDKTFAVPILANYALAGRCSWAQVDPLPFELACVPQRFYHLAKLPVVSYAIPALVAVGQAIYFHRTTWNPIRWLRKMAVGPSMEVLERMQPESGGYLEAIPLTSFVVMSLAATGRAAHAVTQRGVRFLKNTARPDGSWPIDTNLSTWNTSLALQALEISESWDAHRTLRWLLDCQHLAHHPFTGAEPGGWGWSDLSGAVPDADDTSAALLALAHFREWPALVPFDAERITAAATLGVHWLLQLQNSDGGWPTFCKGWGKLPFDRSGTDLTAHALRAIRAWSPLIETKRFVSAVQQGFAFLERNQNSDGSWTPLWFGNQDQPREENPIYGTARVLAAYRAYSRWDALSAGRARSWLASAQQPDGGWGTSGGRVCGGTRGASGVEETALAVETLVAGPLEPALQPAALHGVRWLIEAVEAGRYREPSPIGLYFAKLWYYEQLYPITFTVSALRAALATVRDAESIAGGRDPQPPVST